MFDWVIGRKGGPKDSVVGRKKDLLELPRVAGEEGRRAGLLLLKSSCYDVDCRVALSKSGVSLSEIKLVVRDCL